MSYLKQPPPGVYADQQAILKLTENTESFLLKLHKTSDTLNITERQKILRLTSDACWGKKLLVIQ